MKVVYKFHHKWLQKVFRKFLFWCLGWFSLKSLEVLSRMCRWQNLDFIQLLVAFGFSNIPPTPWMIKEIQGVTRCSRQEDLTPPPFSPLSPMKRNYVQVSLKSCQIVPWSAPSVNFETPLQPSHCKKSGNAPEEIISTKAIWFWNW